MSNNVWPAYIPGLGYSVVKTPEDPVEIQSSPSFSEFSMLQAKNPRWHFELLYDFLRDNLQKSVGPLYTDLQVMMGFFLQQGSSYDDFLFIDPDDFLVTNQASTLVQNTDTGDWLTPVQRNMGGLFLEDITDLNPLNGSGLVVTANNVTKLINVDFTLQGPGLSFPGGSFGGMYLNWGAVSPAPTIRLGFSFYFRVRFEEPKLAFEKWANMWWTLGGEQASKSDTVKLVTKRPVGV